LHADARFDWSLLVQAASCGSLFSERRIVEIRLPSGKPGKEGARELQAHAAAMSHDVLTLISVPKLERSTRESAWAGALESAGVWVDVRTVDRPALPDWIAERLARQRQRVSTPALEFLSERVEGNLLAAHQEVSKLALLYGPGELSFEQVKDTVLDVARFDVFSLSQAILEGDCARLTRTIEGLRSEGEALPLALWVVCDTLRSLLRLKHAIGSGRPFEAAAREARIWGTQLAASERAVARVSTTSLAKLLGRCALLDQSAKGLAPGFGDSDPWLELTDITISAARP
jgi:DNA polymerase III subunit delta